MAAKANARGKASSRDADGAEGERANKSQVGDGEKDVGKGRM